MEPVDLLGIHFRSLSHALWFMVSMGVLLIVTLFYIREAQRGLPPNRSVAKSYALAHMGTALLAVLRTRGGTVDTEAFSVDCIWFNPLMAMLHIVVHAAFLAYYKRQLREI